MVVTKALYLADLIIEIRRNQINTRDLLQSCLFWVGVIPGSAQGLTLAMCSEISPSSVWGTI